LFIENEASKKYALAGTRFQLPMIFLWGFRGFYTKTHNLELSLSNIRQDLAATSLIAWLGFTIMGVCMIRIYRNKTGKLITSDLFALTRHPMYHGMYLADVALFWEADLSNISFWVSWIIFTGLIFTAGWYQEKETLARWGEDARKYYDRAPRFIFEWIWFRGPKT
jgi:protein-S-isoprenylcysteine O-methyltransferase Ste14